MTEEQLKKQLVQQLFEDTSEGGYGGHESSSGKLIFYARVFEGERESRGVKDLLKVSFQNKDAKETKETKDDNDDDDDDDDNDNDKPNLKDKQKPRIICLSVKKGVKIRLSKLKQERFGSLTVLKVWGIDEVRSLENGEDWQILINLGKTHRWTFEDGQKKLEFLEAVVKLCRTHVKKMPKLINMSDSISQDNPTVAATDEYGLASSPNKNALIDQEIGSPEQYRAGSDEAYIAMEALPDIDLGLVLSDFQWQAGGDAAALEARLVSELQALEAANVHDIIQSETQANIVVEEIERTLMELTQIDDWLLHYTSLLDSMGQDVHQIETQNKGMQVASSNQRCLLASVEKLLGSLRIPGYTLDVLRNEPLDDHDGVRECEAAVQKLMDIIQAKYTEMGDMAADMYLMDKARMSQRGSLKLYAHENLEQRLFKFRTLLRWLKDVDARAHLELQMAYVKDIARPYKRETQEFIEILKSQHTQRKVAVEEMEFLFSGSGVSVSSVASNAIKSAIRSGASNLSTVNTDRGATTSGIKQKLESWRPYRKKLGKSVDYNDPSGGTHLGEDGLKETISKANHHEFGSLKNSSLAGSSTSLDLSPEERMSPDEAVGHALLKMVNIMVREQNFIIDLFGILKGSEGSNSTTPTISVAGNSPGEPNSSSPTTKVSLQAWQDDLGRPREPIKDPKAQKRIQEMMEGIFEDTREQLVSTIESGLKYDQSFSVGMLVHIEFYSKEYANTSHVFVINLLESLQKRAATIFDKFIVDQIKAIDDTKVTLRKRGGILPFIKTFPKFVDRMEAMLSNWDGITRKTVDKAYSRLIKSIFETLDAVAQQAGNDPKVNNEEKDSLNIHILNVENMHHFHAEVRARKVPGLDSFSKQAKVLYDVNLEAYCKVVIRKPLGKLLEFFEGIEGLLKTGPVEEVPYHIQYSKSAVKDVIRKYPGKEVKKGLEALYKRVDKHYTEEEGLLQVVWRGIQEEFTRQLRRYEELIAKCYPEVSVRLDFTMEELLEFFSELALAH
ncbi:hypothetical protein BASA61_005440 [Batrachochytrium salamandrivorans]|nr:hypothetical protein BASA61_005440 [Batrachochytrium salamandrivorans]